MEEIWRPVVGYEGFYEISNLGNLVRVSTLGKKPCRKPRAFAVKKGYRAFHMCAKGVRKYRLAHIMVWEAFYGSIPKGVEMNHKNGDRNDPSLENLELVTRSQNIRHSFLVLGKKTNFKPMNGEENGCSKLTDADVLKIRDLYAAGGVRQKDIADKFGVSQRMISLIVRREKWQHI